MSKEELLPCPFCGSINVEIDEKDGLVWVGCECGCRGEWFRSTQKDQARKAWNTRPGSKQYRWQSPLLAQREMYEHIYDQESFSAGFNAAREHKGEG